MFLTTNRVQAFDPAFQSRIHLTITYPKLSPQNRSKIWKTLTPATMLPPSWDQEAFDRLGHRYTLNGRQIKNLIRTALAIAKWREQLLSEDLLETVYNLNQSQPDESKACQ
jgi:ATP-dependent 26S proteasome regulatory subunit